MAETTSWGLTPNERRTVLGIRAVGLLLVGMSCPLLSTLAVWASAVIRQKSGEGVQWGTLLDQLRDKAVLLNLASWTGAHIAMIGFGVFLMRCDPRPLLRAKGAKP